MLTVLTKYLFRYRRVCIPNIGTFEIVQHAPQLDVANQMITPPVYRTRHISSDKVSGHQLRFAASKEEREDFERELFSFGEKLLKKIQSAPFHWKGLGTLRYVSNEILFEPDDLMMESLQAVPAQKVLRENVQHSVLVGDQQMTSGQVTEALNQVESKRPWFIIAGWILFALAAIAIVLFLYMKHFQTGSTGLQKAW